MDQTLNFMKRIILVLSILFIGFSAKAQFHYYNPYLYAAYSAEANAEAIDSRQLNNVRFDENAIKQNPEAWAKYNDYLALNADYAKKLRAYNIVGWTGVGAMCLSLIPSCVALGYETNDFRYDVSMGVGLTLLSAGAITSCVGLIGATVQTSKIKTNKREFIFYLKTSNNGVGVVTLF